MYSAVRPKYENANTNRQIQIVKSINDISVGLGDAFTNDKVSFEEKLAVISDEDILHKLQSLFEGLRDTEKMQPETPLATENEPEKPGSS